MSIADVVHAAGEMALERLEAEITELAGHLAAAECRWLLLTAERATSAELERVVRSCRGVLSNEEECEESNERHAQRFFRLDPCDDGSFAISGRLPAESAALVMAALQAAQHVATEQAPAEHEPVDKGGPAGPPDGNLTAKPEVAATNADALVMMAESFLAHGHGRFRHPHAGPFVYGTRVVDSRAVALVRSSMSTTSSTGLTVAPMR
ncbi:MAG: DUF222 domain-containing protein [Actinobacteria bacterium]|nr:DUF222 domain-containing protein [Actinomycetota bacterium]